METRRLLIAALLSMAVLIVWQKLFPPPTAVAPAPAETQTVEAEPVVEPSMTDSAATSSEATAPSTAEAEEVSAAAEETAIELEEIAAAAETTVILETDAVRAEWSNQGAKLIHLELKDHPANGGGTVDLVRKRVQNLAAFSLLDESGQPSPLNEALFAVERRENGATFSYRGARGAATKTVDLSPDGLFEIKIEASGGWRVLLGPGLRNPTPKEAKNRFARRAAVYSRGGEIERLDVAKIKESVVVSGTALSWIGLQDQYFLAAVLPRQGLREAVVEPMLFEVDEEGVYSFRSRPLEVAEAEEDLGSELRLLLVPEDQSLAVGAYLGAKQFRRLKSLPGGLEGAVDLGIFAFLGRPLLIALHWIYDNVVSNFGWAIVLLTFLLRVVLFPLNHKSIVSMEKMQKVNPKMQAIRAKYRSKLKDKKGRPNPEASSKMNQEIMELYKKEGVNPAGGCLPMLLQMPVLFAFYGLLSAAVELRHAPWLGWVQDLSAPDPYYVLPIVMGVSMLLQQRMTPTQADPMQQKLFMFMPIIFTVLFLGFPSGMVLYWLTNNILAIAQQAGYKRFRAASAASGDAGGSKR